MVGDPLSLLQDQLIVETPDWVVLRRALARYQTGLSGRDLILCGAMDRLADALKTLRECINTGQTGFGVPDVVVLLRQIVRWSHPLKVHPELWTMIRTEAESAGLVGSPTETDCIEIMAIAWQPNWLPNATAIDVLERRRVAEASLGDGMLSAMSQAAGSGWSTYQSDAQKAAVDCWNFAPPGSTTLVTLPTGGGKSLCALLPPWFATRGGRHSQGTTLVVVPTVALALDQERQAAEFFPRAAGEYSRPISRTGDTTPEERRAIEAALRDGRLPVIYTSPESLLGSRLYDVCLQASRAGLITRFVIDEAHLIVSWGAGFRPEFQLLAAYRRKLLQASGGQLRTLLLSATVDDRGRELIEDQFSERGRLVVVEANRLRPEIGYWLSFARSAAARREHVLEALRYLPRPLILYVTRPKQARDWESDLRNRGFVRLASFSGDTDADSRRQLISAWNNNQIDIMIATSAFGLGVDKRDIRAVVHATLPENIDRFYQEVGRGGRDGYSAVSLVCATEDSDEMKSDVDLAYSLQGRIITLDKALPRWLGMLETARADGDVRWVDRDATPEGRPEVGRSERNREWNDHLLLLMQRARLVEIADATPPRVGEDGTLLYHLPIRILVPEVFNDPSHALDRIEPFREREKEENRVAAKGIISLVSDYARGNANDCLSSRFAAMYANVQRACGGCPVCRTSDQDPFCDPLEFSVHFPVALRRLVSESAEISATLRRKLGAWRSFISTWNGPRTLHGLASSVDLIPQLVHAGFQQVIYPADWLEDAPLRDRFVRALATPGPHQQPNFHRIVPDRWVYAKDYPLFPLATVIVYSPENLAADRLYGALGRAERQGIVFPSTIHLVHEAVYLSSVGRRFVEHVDGLVEPVARLQVSLHGSEQPPEFF